ncbi:flagellar basal body-associated protein FliL [Pseudodesulfovibrio hydrargyri]|uniref:Flagellar protein FliL n=1 Tax=Pseudodesulfovibrio hydrargyri TaxID=2125990 RepID=A0A1J5N0E8_9BACT|nr:flagellar basal body-associated FliL family protein [Pseudodesulfovibrio hydrargyri]OIQ51738.1 flagellar basal body-associated protein FliL [Pseudodesulfovibrio hydrargyri]
MVLLVPDDAEDVTDAPAERKAELDDAAASKATQKVDLDLDDAPFLEDEDEEEDIEEVESETPFLTEDEGKPKPGLVALLKNKFVLMGLGVILLLLVVIIILLLREPEAPPPPPPPPVEQPAIPEPPPEVPETPQIIIKLDPFLIEQTDAAGKIRFLEVSILLSTEDDGLARQFKQETFAVRNALYYYLKNKDLQFLSDKENSEKLKRELLVIINQYMGFGQFDTLMFEQYLVR